MSRTVLSVFGIAPSRIGGNEYWCREFSTQLATRNWKSVLCFLEPPPPYVRKFLELPNVRFEVLPDAWRSGVAPAKAFLRLLWRYHPQIVHLHFVGFISVYPWLAKLAGADRVFFTDQASHPEGFIPQPAPHWRQLATRVINYPLDRVICVSDYNLCCMKTSSLLPLNRLTRVYNSVDFSRLSEGNEKGAEFRRKFSIPSDRAVITQVSWMIPEKGILDLLNAARLVIPRFPNVQFVLVGEGKWRAEFSRAAEEWGIADHITWTGMVGNPTTEGVFAAADVVCQVSRWEEAFGWTIAEAMAFSRPIIATRVGGIAELVEDEKSGYLVERGNSEAIAKNIHSLLKDPALRQSMGQRGEQIARERFGLRDNVAKVMKLYGLFH